MKPKALIEKFVQYFNEGDAEKLAELYHEDACNHQVANELIIGKSAIKEMFNRVCTS